MIIYNNDYFRKMKAIDLSHIVTDYINSKGDEVSPKKLQKLLYYIEAWHLVYFSEPLIDEDFEAWVHGPVIPKLYREFKNFGYNDIKLVNDELDNANERIDKIAAENGLSPNQMDLIYSVLKKYGTLSSFELEMLSHNEKPWQEARGDIPPHERCANIISKTTMKSFYSSLK